MTRKGTAKWTEEVERRGQAKTTYVRYKLDGAKANITQFQSRERCVQEAVDRILGRAGWRKTGNDRIRNQLVKNLRSDLHDYVTPTLAVVHAPATTRRGRLGGSVLAAVTNTTDSLKALIETVVDFCRSSSNGS